jgi:3',5'-cyclic AMP phosphodiesterase CpdA
VKIIHMSDLHVGSGHGGDCFRSLVGRLVDEKANSAKQYVIVLTGDLVEDANDSRQYQEVRSSLDALRDAGFDRLLLAPGNHDYGTGDLGHRRFVEEFKKTFWGGEFSYPRLDMISGAAFICLDSMAEELHWYDRLFAEGELGDEQLGRLAEMLARQDVRDCARRVVYMHHHPFDSFPLHQLKDSEELREVLSASRPGVDALLYGHNHRGRAHNGRWGIPRCYDAGTATMKGRPAQIAWLPWFKVRASTRVIDLDGHPHRDYVFEL